ncbi:MAG: bifunctional diaminohydroxyphosphoribosylaminopyrimidine deaminase/5-amino-6-(5-phosphoribosylamino)uracil reductase RibD [Desulfovibrio sp.]|jgi:diaminohydroxyphosphoribosylaminopyrimidine deaminase/5-amino-6-(5-phosphoribosylamino)uracil reductase|nr:bifunctional diaminohydroxyphosphoribosylaminopyrimidine deaminase/5-amino-6-(5-phosphoribosylamino)uracil reductase RibD [Desulfovibrio sp.]
MTEQATDYTPFMREALRLAERGRYAACPNPTVGAVLVRDGRCVAQGFHRAAGQAHAEVACLKDASARGVPTAGTTLVVTLEPCNHHGKTPPCVKAILGAGIGRVVVGARDPNPLAAGGTAALRAAGVEVTEGVLERECRDLIADFLVWQTTERPYVILKMAATLDGRIAARNGHSQWISSESSRLRVRQWRAGIGQCGGAVLVGGGTFRADNPRLTARGEFAAEAQPLACILTSRLPGPGESFRLLAERPEQTIFFTPPTVAGSDRAEKLRAKGVRVLNYGHGPKDGEGKGGADLPLALTALRRESGCPYVLCEGGGRLALSLLEAGLVDEFRLHLAPKVLADNEAVPLFTGRASESMEQALSLRLCGTSLCDGDAHLVLRPEIGPI